MYSFEGDFVGIYSAIQCEKMINFVSKNPTLISLMNDYRNLHQNQAWTTFAMKLSLIKLEISEID